MVPAHDPVALAAAMSALMTDTDGRRVYADKAAIRARDFSWNRVVDAYTALYDELAGHA